MFSTMLKRATTQTSIVQNATANGNLQRPSTTAESSSFAWINAIKLAACVAGGVVFGFAAEKAKGELVQSMALIILLWPPV